MAVRMVENEHTTSSHLEASAKLEKIRSDKKPLTFQSLEAL
jgi:hypothetical protein